MLNVLIYKVKNMSIAIEIQEESYTSQCNSYAEEVTENASQKRNRKYRGLYTVNIEVFNADCVGAYNILKKHLYRIGKPIPTVVGWIPQGCTGVALTVVLSGIRSSPCKWQCSSLIHLE